MTREVQIQTIELTKDNQLVETGNFRKVTIKPMKPYQFAMVSKSIHNLINEINADENIKGTLSGVIDNLDTDMDIVEFLQTAGTEFLNDSLGTIGKLLVIAPERTFDIISILSGIDIRELTMQEMDVFFEIADAVIEENDFGKLVNQLKKSGKSLIKTLNFREVVGQATALSPVK